jgi:hypothetical protein
VGVTYNMIIKEFRVILPMTVDEYKIAQLWSVAESSKRETGGGEGIEVLINEPITETQYNTSPDGKVFPKGQYTHKRFHLQSKVPTVIRLLAPKGSLEIDERAWNDYPYCLTLIDNPGYLKENFFIRITSWHKSGPGDIENVHNLSPQDLKTREVIYIDIAGDPVAPSDYKEDCDPSKFVSAKTGRGPFQGKEWWKNYDGPVMCAYKLVTAEFKWWGLQTRIEAMIARQERRIFHTFHRQVVCWMDNWHGLTIEDIREVERQTKEELDRRRATGQLCGHDIGE